jgi:release factor glutamine methyltransferase
VIASRFSLSPCTILSRHDLQPFIKAGFSNAQITDTLSDMQTIQALLQEAQTRLSGDEAIEESERLMEDICGISRTYQFSHPEDELTEEQVNRFLVAVERRADGEPLAYITGSRGFWDMELQVSKGVLIPRPDTECLVEQALARIPAGAKWQVLDLGTGSGAIAIAIARERMLCEVTATDISASALDIARENAGEHGAGRIEFLCGYWFLPLSGREFDVIVCNPPYICSDDPHLKIGDLPSEPSFALVAGSDGLDAIRQIVDDSMNYLKTGGWLLFEHGYEQAGDVRALLEQSGFSDVFTEKDHGGQGRVSGGKKG